ncbi:endospore germination permease [Lysinibacillus sp. KU-BSD001]|uniref:GerAB/ArcD/ProY family transporter n=1 Tax=Lysinibacillus sp. KU-BSD001 TaxID=3141328 RepID=UPI0036ED7CAC
MNKSVKFSMLHVIFLCMTVIGLKNHVTILPPILEQAKRDGWMSVLIAAGILIPWLLLLAIITKRLENESFMSLLEKKSKSIAVFVKWLISLLVLVLGAFTMVEMLQWINTTFLPTTPMLILFGVYFILCITLATRGLQTMVILNVVVLFGVIIFGFLVAFVNIKVKDYSLLQPMLEHGMGPVLLAVVFPAAGFTELLLLIFIQHHVKSQIKYKHFVLMLLILVGLTMGPLIGAIVEFGPEEASKQRYPAYEEWGLASIGQFISHMDFLSVYQWMTGAFIRIGFYLYIVTELWGVQKETKKVWYYIAPPFGIICLMLMLVDEQTFLNINNYHILISTCILLLLLGFIFALLTGRKKGRRQEDISDAKPKQGNYVQ